MYGHLHWVSKGMIERLSQTLLDPISKTRTWELGGCRARRRDKPGVVPTPRSDIEKGGASIHSS
jgi:hypothetical protein